MTGSDKPPLLYHNGYANDFMYIMATNNTI